MYPGQPQIQRIEQLVNEAQYNNARSESAHLISHTLEGLRYLQTSVTPPPPLSSMADISLIFSYDRTLIRIMAIVAYVGWIAYGAVAILPRHLIQPEKSPLLVNLASTSALFAFWTSFAFENSPWTFYLYIIFPNFFWREVFRTTGGSIITLVDLRQCPTSRLLRELTQSLLVVAALQGKVESTSFNYLGEGPRG